jgi:hypothetical protein
MEPPGEGPVNSDRWQKIESIFHAVISVPAEERLVRLAFECGDDTGLRDAVADLLANEAQAASFLESGVDTEPIVGPEAASPLVGRIFGPYEIVSLLGRWRAQLPQP